MGLRAKRFTHRPLCTDKAFSLVIDADSYIAWMCVLGGHDGGVAQIEPEMTM
jgi:hypothetical protein